MTTLDTLEPVGLTELDVRAALLTRVDRKYVLDRPPLDRLLARVPGDAQVLQIEGEREFGYDSLYLDSDALDAFYLAARNRRRRWKVRYRTYVCTRASFLEVKTRRGAVTVKERIPSPTGSGLDAEGAAFVAGRLDAAGWGGALPPLTPVLRSRYRRATLLLPRSSSRVTIDTDLAWSDVREGTRLARPGLVIVKTKTGSSAGEVDHLLWSLGHRPTTFSKYAAGLAALRPGLPRNRWHRLLAGLPLGAPRP